MHVPWQQPIGLHITLEAVAVDDPCVGETHVVTQTFQMLT